VEVLLRQVDAAHAVVLRDVLPVLHELQTGADPVRELDALGGGPAEDVQHEFADGIRRELAVADQIVERRIAGDQLVLPVGLDQAEQWIGR
jgi:hypothetical protein